LFSIILRKQLHKTYGLLMIV